MNVVFYAIDIQLNRKEENQNGYKCIKMKKPESILWQKTGA